MDDIDISPEAVVEAMQKRRMAALLDPGAELPGKDEMMLMRDLTKTAVDQKRIMVEDDSNKANRELAENMAKILAQSRENPFRQGNTVEGRAVELPDAETPELELVEDEISTEQSTLSYKSVILQEEDE